VGVGTQDPLREAWPQVFYRQAQPRETVFVNLAIPGATVAEALARQVPEAVELRPALATVWLNVNDLVAGVPPAEYEAQLAEVVGRLRRAGARVLVANTPELDGLPAYQRCRDGTGCPFAGGLPEPEALRGLVAAYNASIAAVAGREAAVVVDLRAVGLAARAAGTEGALVSDDGFHPSPAGHQAVAKAFENALRLPPA
jgi:lysophospholipase L1-like esterase